MSKFKLIVTRKNTLSEGQKKIKGQNRIKSH